MTWEEIEKDWSRLQKRHRMEIAQAVARYCICRKMEEVADRLGFTLKWVNQQLDFAGVAAATDDPTRVGSWVAPDSSEVGSSAKLRPAVNRVVSEFAPSVTVRYEGRDKSRVANIEGDDAEAFEPYLQHYIDLNHEPAAATRLAKAEWAAEAAIEAGVIKESVTKQNEKLNQILFPDEQRSSFAIDLEMHMARVKSAAKFLDNAKMNSLRAKSTCEKVALADKAWQEQMERLQAFHPTFTGE